jgi:ATPase family associated with various cellular activities (AAA)
VKSIATTRNGRFVVLRQPDGLHIVDALGPRPRRRIPGGIGDVVACVGTEAWWVNATGTLRRTALATDDPPIDGPEACASITSIIPSSDGLGVLLEGRDKTWLVDARSSSVLEIEGDIGMRVLAVEGRRIVETSGATGVIRTIGRRDAVALPMQTGIALAAGFVLGGRAVAVWVRDAVADAILVCTTAGKLIHRIVAPVLTTCVFAEDANLAIGASGAGLSTFDLRYGSLRGTGFVENVVELAIDRQGRHIVAGIPEAGSIAISRFSYDELFSVRPLAVEPEADPVELLVASPSPMAPSDESASPPEPLPDHVPLALGAPNREPMWFTANGAAPFADASEHLARVLDVVAARTALAIAESWHSGRSSHDAAQALPSEHEVLGLLGEDVGLAADALRRARTRLRVSADELAARTEASLAAGLSLPFHQLAREYELSPIATQILACAVAPRLRTSIARLYGVLAGVQGRSACADHLLDALVEAEPTQDLAQAIARELGPEATLIRTGLVRLIPRMDCIEVGVDAVLVDRLRGLPRLTRISDATTRRTGDRDLADVVAPVSVKRALILGLADRDPARPARIVIRGRRGAGRHTLIAAIARRVDRAIAAIDVTMLSAGANLPPALAQELIRANLAGCVPVVSGLEAIGHDPEVRIHVQTLLRRHPGPLVLRSAPDAELPLDPERIEVTLPALSLGERAAAWERALSRRDLGSLDDAVLAMLAARFRFGTGTIERIADEVARRAARDFQPTAQLVDEIARQHIAGRLERIATRVTRLADWDQVTLVDDMRDSVRELIGRMQHQRTVYESWGFDGKIATARGLTALFYGPPGTGKTMVAGLIGRELALDVWRIDLARVTSKWVGETEKNLAEVFEAAEEGQVLLLFDEADSLFGKRSEVKSSNDRYANLETNYLLQRLDAFEGVAILTTNLEGSIDPAFKRRLSMRLYFPFPDEELRAQLWAAHIPPSVPCAGTLDFEDLARRYPLSGGYIRNSALRAAFLAAQQRSPLTQEHLVRAVQLEYRELGKLSSSGRMD